MNNNMMMIVAIFPAIISLGIYLRRNEKRLNSISALVHYAYYILLSNIVPLVIIYYIYDYDPTFEEFNRFGFTWKYSIIAVGVSIVVPYVEELIGKYISVSFTIENRDQDKNK